MSLSSKWQRWRVTLADRAASPSPFLHPVFSFSLLCRLVRCIVVTCESARSRHARMIIGVRMSTIAREFQPDMQHKLSQILPTHSHTDTHHHSHTPKKGNLIVCKATHWNVIDSTYLIHWRATSKYTEPDSHSPTRVFALCAHVFDCMCVWWTALLNNTSLTRQSCDFKVQHMLRDSEERKTPGRVGVGGLKKETKIQDEQWWEGQRRGNGYSSSSTLFRGLVSKTFSRHSFERKILNDFWSSKAIF